MSGIFERKFFWLFVGISSAISFYIFFYHLGRFPLENWDEAWYGEATREMVRTHNLITLQWDRMLWLDKPPLQIWINSLLSVFLGFSELSIRLVSAVSAFIISIGVAVYSYKKFGLAPAILGFGTLVLNNIFVWRARSGNLDLLSSLLIFATYFLLLSKNKYKYSLLGLSFAAIFLCKASLVLLPFAIFLLNEVCFERQNFKKNIAEYARLTIFFLAPIAIWLGLGYLKEGWKFVNYYLFSADQGVGSISGVNTHYFSYAYYALQRRFFFLFLIGIGFLLMKIKTRENFLLLLYSLLLLLQLSFTQRSNNWYLLPAMAFWSITIAYGLYSILKLFRNNKIVTLGILAITALLFYKTYSVNIVSVLNSSSTMDQSESARIIAKLSSPNDVIIRLDILCPTTIFYSDRKVLCSVPEVDRSGNYWISREDARDGMTKGQLKWIVGSTGDVQNFINDSGLPFKIVYSNFSESVGEIEKR